MNQTRRELLIETLETKPLLAELGGNWYLQPSALFAVAELLRDLLAPSEPEVSAVAERHHAAQRERRDSNVPGQVRSLCSELLQARAKIADLEAQLMVGKESK